MKVELSSYDPSWPKAFQAERGFLQELIGDWLVGTIEHVGSTAVPGMVAKPVIDIIFGVESLPASSPDVSSPTGIVTMMAASAAIQSLKL